MSAFSHPIATIRLCLLAAIMAASPLHAATTLDGFFGFNGSFELGDADTVNSWDTKSGVFPVFPGWLVSNWRGGHIETGSEAQDGQRYFRLSNSQGSGSGEFGYLIANHPADWPSGAFQLEQHQKYELSFWAAGGVGPRNGLTASSSAFLVTFVIPSYTQQEFDAIGQPLWQHYRYEFTANTTTMDILFLADENPYDNAGNVIPLSGVTATVYLDNLSIAKVPEPGALVALGALGILGVRRRRMTATRASRVV
jgi:hypothetical protein